LDRQGERPAVSSRFDADSGPYLGFHPFERMAEELLHHLDRLIGTRTTAPHDACAFARGVGWNRDRDRVDEKPEEHGRTCISRRRGLTIDASKVSMTDRPGCGHEP